MYVSALYKSYFLSPILFKFGTNTHFCNSLVNFIAQKNPIVIYSPPPHHWVGEGIPQNLVSRVQKRTFRRYSPESPLKWYSTCFQKSYAHCSFLAYLQINICIGWLQQAWVVDILHCQMYNVNPNLLKFRYCSVCLNYRMKIPFTLTSEFCCESHIRATLVHFFVWQLIEVGWIYFLYRFTQLKVRCKIISELLTGRE